MPPWEAVASLRACACVTNLPLLNYRCSSGAVHQWLSFINITGVVTSRDRCRFRVSVHRQHVMLCRYHRYARHQPVIGMLLSSPDVAGPLIGPEHDQCAVLRKLYQSQYNVIERSVYDAIYYLNDPPWPSMAFLLICVEHFSVHFHLTFFPLSYL